MCFSEEAAAEPGVTTCNPQVTSFYLTLGPCGPCAVCPCRSVLIVPSCLAACPAGTILFLYGRV